MKPLRIVIMTLLVTFSFLGIQQPLENNDKKNTWDNRYMLINGPDARRISESKWMTYLSACSNGKKALKPLIYYKDRVRVYPCEV